MENRFQGILKIAEVKETDAAQVYIQAKEVWEFNQSKLDELRAFRAEYHQEAEAVSYRPQQFQSTRNFLSQLSVAIDSQETEVARTFSRLGDEESHWLASRVKRKSIETLSAKRDAEHEARRDKMEQIEIDELSRRDRPQF
jgi:flagellar export protein FliJ